MPSIEDVRAVLEARDLSRFIGHEEDQFFEIKGKNPYDLGSARDRYELAKDVCSFCNASGGYIVVGLEHERLQEKAIDRVKGLELIAEEEFDTSRYRGIIQEYIHPKVDELEVEWVESANNKGSGVGFIDIKLIRATWLTDTSFWFG